MVLNFEKNVACLKKVTLVIYKLAIVALKFEHSVLSISLYKTL